MLVIKVPSADGTETYTIRQVADGVWVCDCPDHVFHSHGAPYACKHLTGLATSLAGFVTSAKKSDAAVKLLESL